MQPKSDSELPASMFADTEPMPLRLPQEAREPHAAQPRTLASTRRFVAPDLDSLSLSLAPLEVSLYEAMAEIGRDSRVCPLPTRWMEFYRLLQDAAAAGVKLPPAPLSGSAWASTPAVSKRMCFREQMEWAAAHGCLQPAYEFIKSLPATDWYYLG